LERYQLGTDRVHAQRYCLQLNACRKQPVELYLVQLDGRVLISRAGEPTS
jgi:hypothetical protein